MTDQTPSFNRIPDSILQYDENLGDALAKEQVLGGIYMMNKDTVKGVYTAGFAQAFMFITEQIKAGWSFEEIMADIASHVWNGVDRDTMQQYLDEFGDEENPNT